MTSATDEPTFIRRKFTITESLDEMLVEFSNRHYRGNVSLCIRAAIEDHQQSLEGEGELALSRLMAQVGDLNTQQADILEQLQALDEALKNRSESTQPTISGGSSADNIKLVKRELSKADGGLRVDDLVDRLPLDLPRIQSALGCLVDRGEVIDRDTALERFWLVGNADTDSGGSDE